MIHVLLYNAVKFHFIDLRKHGFTRKDLYTFHHNQSFSFVWKQLGGQGIWTSTLTRTKPKELINYFYREWKAQITYILKYTVVHFKYWNFNTHRATNSAT